MALGLVAGNLDPGGTNRAAGGTACHRTDRVRVQVQALHHGPSLPFAGDSIQTQELLELPVLQVLQAQVAGSADREGHSWGEVEPMKAC